MIAASAETPKLPFNVIGYQRSESGAQEVVCRETNVQEGLINKIWNLKAAVRIPGMKILANSSSITGGINSQPKSSREVCKDMQNHLFGGVEDKYVVSCMKEVEKIFALIMFDCIFGI